MTELKPQCSSSELGFELGAEHPAPPTYTSVLSPNLPSVLSASMVLHVASTEGFLRECICFFVFHIEDATAKLTHEFLCFAEEGRVILLKCLTLEGPMITLEVAL